MLDSILKERDLLPILTHEDGTSVTPETWQKRREELLRALETYSYGVTPTIPVKVRGEVVEENVKAYANKALQQKVNITIETEHGEFTFPVWLFIPKRVEKPPVILHTAFRFGQPKADPPIRRVPVEEILDHGYALVSLPYGDVVNDNLHGDFSDGLAAYFGVNKENRKPDEWGKIGMWAYAASRTMDYLETRANELDIAHTAIIGHSRLGKTSLWAGAQDERFWCVISNDSGYGGAATSKHGSPDGEKCWHFGDWYNGNWDGCCNNFMNYSEKEDEKPYDQSWLLAAVAPRLLYVGSAVEDLWADPASEFISTLWASQTWEMLGKPGLITPDKMPEAGEVSADGDVGYHMRFGSHFLSREDWNNYIAFMDRHLGR